MGWRLIAVVQPWQEDHIRLAVAHLGIPADTIQFRAFASKQVGSLHGPRLRAFNVNNRPAIIYSQEDLSVGMVGQPIDGIVGYTPASGTAIMKSLVQWAAANP